MLPCLDLLGFAWVCFHGAFLAGWQALMELILAAKQTFEPIGLLSPSASAPSAGAGRQYLQGREGPSLCSLVDISRQNVLPTMSARAGESQRTGLLTITLTRRVSSSADGLASGSFGSCTALGGTSHDWLMLC